jgi:hypothetical protein
MNEDVENILKPHLKDVFDLIIDISDKLADKYPPQVLSFFYAHVATNSLSFFIAQSTPDTTIREYVHRRVEVVVESAISKAIKIKEQQNERRSSD